MILIVVVALVALGPERGETCDPSRCCCVDSATATQSNSKSVSIRVTRSGTNCDVQTESLSCDVLSDTICIQEFGTKVFRVYRSGRIAYVVTNFNDDTCNSRVRCDSGSCANTSVHTTFDWAGSYSKTSDEPEPWPPRCDPKRCCCADSATVSGTDSALTLVYTPTADSICSGYDRINVSCTALGLYMYCGSIGDGLLVKKNGGRTHYLFQHSQECNDQFECTSGGCTSTGVFTGQYEAAGSVPAWSFATGLFFAIASLSYSY